MIIHYCSRCIKMEHYALCTNRCRKTIFLFSLRMSKLLFVLFVIILMMKLSEARKGSSSCGRHYSRPSSRFQPAGRRVQRRYCSSRSRPSGNFRKQIFRNLTKLEIIQQIFKFESRFSRR